MDVVSGIVSIISLLCIVVISIRLYILFKKRKNVSWDVKQGIRCYSCKVDLTENLDTQEKYDKLDEIYNKIDKVRESWLDI